MFMMSLPFQPDGSVEDLLASTLLQRRSEPNAQRCDIAAAAAEF